MGSNAKSSRKLQNDVFRSQAGLISSLAFFLAAAGIVVNSHSEALKRDQNLLNVAETAASSPLVSDASEDVRNRLIETMDALGGILANVDVVSVVGRDGIRRYHTNHALIGTVYDGLPPDFSNNRRSYAISSSGPSGAQRRAYAAIYDSKGNNVGFVIAVMLRRNIRREILQILATFTLVAGVALIVELIASYKLSEKIKNRLLGYEPDLFSAMYSVRESVLESLEEGVIAVDAKGTVQFINRSAAKMLGIDQGADAEATGKRLLGQTLEHGTRETNVAEKNATGANLLLDRAPILDGDKIVGAVGVLRDRTEYVKLAENLSGARFLVDSMRANNHDFTNKLHVILGLLQMKEFDQAASYIENVAFVQREGISKIVREIDEPAVAALLVGKTAKAAEFNVKFSLQEGSRYRRSDVSLPSDALVTIIGNLIDNALEAMNGWNRSDAVKKELLVGIHSAPNVLLITVDDGGPGISAANLDRIFENGFTTKGEGHGSGLFQVKQLVESLGGVVSVESTEGVGTSFSVAFGTGEKDRV